MYFRSAFVFTFIPSLLLIGMTSTNFKIQQTPPLVELHEGQSVTISCTVDFHGPKTSTWIKDYMEILQNSTMVPERVRQKRVPDGQKLTTFLEISNLTQCDSATYYCKVIPMVGSGQTGNGTKIIVLRAPESNVINVIFIGVSAGVIAVLVTALIVVSVHLRWRTKACVALQRQFVHYVTEKSTEYMRVNKKARHGVREDGSASSSQEGKKKKRKMKKSNKMDCSQQGNIQ
ncbi:uncharacterized protein [Hemitrygon akajei]|uniref:uncharacterized protein n=1 Tax=Hemitrygon akajei TaxID=2704970 RepID=UPI003BFA157D